MERAQRKLWALVGDLAKSGVGLDLRRTRHRLNQSLLRRNISHRQTKHHCGSRHWARLEELRFDDAVGQASFDSYLLAVPQLEERQLGEVLVPLRWAPGCWSRCRG